MSGGVAAGWATASPTAVQIIRRALAGCMHSRRVSTQIPRGQYRGLSREIGDSRAQDHPFGSPRLFASMLLPFASARDDKPSWATPYDVLGLRLLAARGPLRLTQLCRLITVFLSVTCPLPSLVALSRSVTPQKHAVLCGANEARPDGVETTSVAQSVESHLGSQNGWRVTCRPIGCCRPI